MTSAAALRPLAPADAPGRRASTGRGTLARLRRQPAGLAGLVVLGALVLVSIAAPIVSPYDPFIQDREAVFEAPTPSHVFGTDEFGRDIFTRVIYGARLSLMTGAAAVLVALAVGVPLGLVAGYFGRWVDALLMRFLDFLLAVPAILLAMVIVAILGPGSFNALLAVAVVSIPAFARLTRASTLMLKAREFVLATRAIGAGSPYLMFRTILPNAVSPLLVQMTVAAAHAVLLEAALSFLGLGTRPPEPSLGSMLNTGRSFLHQAPWYGLFPGLVMTAAVLSLNSLSDGLQAMLDNAGAGQAGPAERAS